MIGDVIYVERKPLLWRSTIARSNPNSKKIDKMIFRTTKYRHYGIDAGNGRVIHFTSDSFWHRKDSIIMETGIDEFLKDGKLGIVDDIDRAYSREEIVERARFFMGQNFGGYSIANNNCEHFAMYCATGLRVSRQSYLLKYGEVVPKKFGKMKKGLGLKYNEAGSYLARLLGKR